MKLNINLCISSFCQYSLLGLVHEYRQKNDSTRYKTWQEDPERKEGKRINTRAISRKGGSINYMDRVYRERPETAKSQIDLQDC